MAQDFEKTDFIRIIMIIIRVRGKSVIYTRTYSFSEAALITDMMSKSRQSSYGVRIVSHIPKPKWVERS